MSRDSDPSAACGLLGKIALFHLAALCIGVRVVARCLYMMWQRVPLQRCQVVPRSAPSYWEALSRVGKRTYQVHWAVFRLLKHYLAECYGVDLLVDLFASSEFSLLPKCGLSALGEVLEDCRREGHAVFIHADWTKHGSIVQALRALQLLCVIVAPVWEQHDWYGVLLSFSSHVWFMPSCNGVLSPLSRGAGSHIGSSPWQVVGVFADFRKKAATPVVRQLPPLRECISMATAIEPLSRKATVSSLDVKACLPKPPFDVEFLRKKSDGVVVSGLRECALDSLADGFASGYSGRSYFCRDFSIQLDGDDLKRAMAKMEKELKKGFISALSASVPFRLHDADPET